MHGKAAIRIKQLQLLWELESERVAICQALLIVLSDAQLCSMASDRILIASVFDIIKDHAKRCVIS